MTLIKACNISIALFAIGGCAKATPSPTIATTRPAFNVLVVTSRAKDHSKMMAAAAPMLKMMATDNHFDVDITDDDTVINDANLARYQVFVQLQEAPFDMTPSEQAALQKF